RRMDAGALAAGGGHGLGRGGRAARSLARPRGGGPDAQAPRFAVPARPPARRLVEVEGRSADGGRGADLRAVGQRAQEHAVHRLHLRPVGRGRPGAGGQGLFRPGRPRDPAPGPLDPRAHARALRAGAFGGAGARVRARLRGREPLYPPQVGRGGALPPDPALARGQARGRGRPPRRAAGAGAVMARQGAPSPAASPAPARRRARADAPLAAWFAAQGWRPAPFQRAAWRHYLAGDSGLLVTPTGSGKTLAALGGPLLEALRLGDAAAPSGRGARAGGPRLRLLWITPLRALAVDTVRAIRAPVGALGVPWTVAMRTGDASARDRRLAREGRAGVLVTTPESFALALSYPDSARVLGGVRAVVVDEWHELLGNKRGVLLQLCLARLRALAPGVRTWGLSATLGNLEEARDVLVPHRPDAPILAAPRPRRLALETLIPGEGERFP